MDNLFKQAQEVPQENWVFETVADKDIFENSTFNFGENEAVNQNNNALNNSGVPNQSPTDTKINVGQTIKAPYVIDLLDVAIPPLLKIGLGFAGRKGVTLRELKLNAQEKEALATPTQAYLDTLNITLTPFEAFAITLVAVYGMKVVPILQSPDKKTRGSIDEGDEIGGDLNKANKIRKPRADAGKSRGSYKK